MEFPILQSVLALVALFMLLYVVYRLRRVKKRLDETERVYDELEDF